MLKIKKLIVQYGPLAAINEVSLEVSSGEIVSLLGPNGAGKSTLLLTLSGIIKTTKERTSPISILVRSYPKESDMSLKDAISFQPSL